MDGIQPNTSRNEAGPFSVPSLALNDITLPLASAVPHISIPRLSLGPKPSKPKLRRPSTASSAEDKSILLPTSFVCDQLSVGTSSDHYRTPSPEGESTSVNEKPSIEEVNRRAHAAVAGLRAEASRLASAVDVLPSPFDSSPSDEQVPQGNTGHERTDEQVDYDWATFINAYALGRWDPLRTPQPPRSHLHASLPPSRSVLHSIVIEIPESSEPIFESPVTSLGESCLREETSSGVPSDYEDVTRDSVEGFTRSAPPAYHLPPILASSTTKASTSTLPDGGISKLSDRRPHILPMNLGPFAHRIRNSWADIRSSSNSGSSSSGEVRLPNVSNADVATSAAAIRWAGARVSVAPLALPSPEHELTDPMRGVTATIPGSHPPDMYARPEPLPLQSPTGVRKTRLSSFWQGTQDVEDKLPTIQASPDDSASQSSSEQSKSSSPPSSIPFIGPSVAPATAPIRGFPETEDDDYFGSVDGHRAESASSVTSDQPSFGSSSAIRPDIDLMRQSSAPPFDAEPSTVPALSRRICLTRQTSAPVTSPALYERRLRLTRPASDGSIGILQGRAAKEEQMYNELGYLAPPNPPDELERRRALYKFNIWNTGHDMNFDRIAHLVKLVFSTRIVVIALVDGNDVFFKSESGLGMQNLPRTSSFDAHTILQRDEEPTVVLDAQDDWRFAKNPLTIGAPHIRFYAGCPLRTQDGFNIGTLSIMDDTPRREFSPRQRHTLKEFAQVAMRELELWRDKIQLRIRDRIQTSMEQFTRECLEVDKDSKGEKSHGLFVGTSMEQIYERAARLVHRTLDLEGAVVMDVSHVDVLETFGAESSTSISIHHADPQLGTITRSLCQDEHAKLHEFFARHPDGKISEGVVPVGLRPFLPSRIQYALTVPIFNIDKRPFAVLCAYSTGERTTPFLEGHELSYLRAIGVIILSAVLKRRMILADKAKSLFISNISHELRTPLHGILASAELLSETQLDHSQASFLQTVQACGTSLVETVNHVLDFTKLSGNAKSGGVENIIHRSKVDIMQLVEEATEGCWIGHRARMFTSEIGSVYSPPDRQPYQPAAAQPTETPKHVETVIDIGHNKEGWIYKCEKGGIRRVLMNLFGNSLKFTSDGYVHVMLRKLPPGSDHNTANTVKLELSVIDTGKGISQNFLKNQLFHPFSQENPLQTGTGLGLAIVNSIVRSSSVDGKVDVSSVEGVGTEIRVTFTAEPVEDYESANNDGELLKLYDTLRRPTISLVGFNESHRGERLLQNVLSSYLVSRWGFSVAQGLDLGDIVIVNEDHTMVARAVEAKDVRRPYIILSSARGDPRLMSVVADYEHIGGFCRIAYKPVGPCRLYSVLKLCLHALHIAESSQLKYTSEPLSAGPPHSNGHAVSPDMGERSPFSNPLPRRFSEESGHPNAVFPRPSLGPRALTAHPATSWTQLPSQEEQDDEDADRDYTSDSGATSQNSSSPTVAVGTGGTLLKSSVGTGSAKNGVRVLVVEDNAILRNLLIKWLRNKGYDYRDAADGLDGVRVFESDGRFDVVLLDLSMPVLDGVGATAQMRNIEASRRKGNTNVNGRDAQAARILALTGMSSLEDKRRAFEAGVDGYLVKPVAFKTLDGMFHKLGFS
ncbi:unnamed protein product [Somion occarium]|uniref:histidine kinase n=1 Tax=Somion occarium TaxID=3059160 RepID=A0ABP1EA54_9APHY